MRYAIISSGKKLMMWTMNDAADCNRPVTPTKVVKPIPRYHWYGKVMALMNAISDITCPRTKRHSPQQSCYFTLDYTSTAETFFRKQYFLMKILRSLRGVDGPPGHMGPRGRAWGPQKLKIRDEVGRGPGKSELWLWVRGLPNQFRTGAFSSSHRAWKYLVHHRYGRDTKLVSKTAICPMSNVSATVHCTGVMTILWMWTLRSPRSKKNVLVTKVSGHARHGPSIYQLSIVRQRISRLLTAA